MHTNLNTKGDLNLSGVVIGFQLQMFSPATYQRGEKEGEKHIEEGKKNISKKIKKNISKKVKKNIKEGKKISKMG